MTQERSIWNYKDEKIGVINSWMVIRAIDLKF